MKKMFQIRSGGFRPNNVMLYPERNEAQEFGHPRKNTGVCAWCGAVYRGKAWHHPDAVRRKLKTRPQAAWLGVCGACEMIRNGLFEGQVVISDIPLSFSKELSGLIRAFVGRAYAKDCQHRMIALHKESDTTWVVTVTENQLANKLARKIRDVFKHVDVRVSYSRQGDDVERVRVHFQPSLWQRLANRLHEQLASVVWNRKEVSV